MKMWMAAPPNTLPSLVFRIIIVRNCKLKFDLEIATTELGSGITGEKGRFQYNIIGGW
jgi:hypothetical protein